jgi:hypothetical protein
VTRLGPFAFDTCRSLTDVTIPGSLTDIHESTFAHCTSLKNVTIHNGVINIDDFAFDTCSKLETVTIPSSVRSIGDGAFDECYNLRDVLFKRKTMDQVEAMDNYPWGIEDESIIKCN